MGKFIDLTGKRFGFWLVSHKCDDKNHTCNNNKYIHTRWVCICECGNKICVSSNSLRTGNSTSCGCNKVPDLIGHTFGKITVSSLAIHEDKSRRYWNCQCVCGKSIVVNTYKLRQNIITSCGCNDLFTKNINVLDSSKTINCNIKITMPIDIHTKMLKESNLLIDILGVNIE